MKLFYETHGAGEPLILIPGFASGAWTWFRQIEECAANFRVIAFDPRGIGKSQIENPDFYKDLSMQTFVEDVLQILDDLEIDQVHVAGASFGGFVAQELALNFPARVQKMVLACTSAGGASHVRPSPEILQSFAPNSLLSGGERIRKFIRPAFTEGFDAGEIEEVCRMREQNKVIDAVYHAQLQAALTFDANEKIGAIGHPTLVITGDLDRVVPFENSLHLAKKIPNAELRVIKDGSHMFFIENADQFNCAVKEFLKK